MDKIMIEKAKASTCLLRGIIERAPKGPERDRALEKCDADIRAFNLAIDVLTSDEKAPKTPKATKPETPVSDNSQPDTESPVDDMDDIF